MASKEAHADESIVESTFHQTASAKYGLLVSGFIRVQETQLCLSTVIPKGIDDIVLDFYPKLMKFELFSHQKFDSLADGYEIRGKPNAGCSGYLIYPEPLCPDGYRKGTHYWSVKLLGRENVEQYCYRSIGIVSGSEKSQHDDCNWIYQASDEWPSMWNEGETDHYRGDSMELGKSANIHWGYQDVITVKLDCDAGKVIYFRNDSEVCSRNIVKEKPYFFVMSSCVRNENWFRVVETPLSVL